MGQLQSFFNLLAKDESLYSFDSTVNQSKSSCSDIVSKLTKLQSEYPNLEELNMLIELVEILQRDSEMKWKKSQNSIFKPRSKIDEQDNSDVLAFLINRMHHDIKTKIKIQKSCSNNLLNIKFPIIMTVKYDIICQCEKVIFSTVQSQISLNLTVSSKYTNLQNLFDKIFLGEVVKGFNCETRNCSHKKAVRVCKLCKPLPETICIRVQGRNSFITLEILNEMLIKRSFVIDVSRDDFEEPPNQQTNSNRMENDYRYFLKAIVQNNTNFRYQCYKNDRNKWFLISDESLVECDQPKILEDKDYILFFENQISVPSISGSRVTSLYASKDNFPSSLVTPLSSHRKLYSRFKSKDIMDSSQKSIKELSNFELNYQQSISRKSPVSLKKLGINQYLGICLHSLSSCEVLIKRIQRITQKSMRKMKTFINLIMISDGDYRNAEISNSIIKEWNALYKTNLFHLLLALMNDLRNEIRIQNMNPYPLEINMTVRISCVNCGKHFQYQLTESAFTIAVSGSISNLSLQDSIDMIFQEQILNCYNCENKKCSNKTKSKKSIRMRQPIASTLCVHVEKLIWNGRQNQFIFSKINFTDVLIMKLNYYENNSDRNSKVLSSCNEIFLETAVKKELVYHLQSLISCQFNDKYMCYKKLGNDWYCLTDTAMSNVSLNQVLESDPYILFYELLT